MPTINEYGQVLGTEYYLKTLCETASENNPLAYELYYYDKPLSDVWDKIARIRAKNY